MLRRRRVPSPPRREFPPTVNSLGETICPGCGVHMKGTRRAICSSTCRSRVRQRGGRYTWQDVAEAIETLQ
jgi:hypothetical protein